MSFSVNLEASCTGLAGHSKIILLWKCTGLYTALINCPHFHFAVMVAVVLE